MSATYYTNDILQSLDLFDICGSFFPHPYPNSDSCFRFEKDSHGSSIKFVNLISSLDMKPCPHCGCINRHESKGIRKIFLSHKSNGDMKTVLEVSYRRYLCRDCHHYFKEHIPFKAPYSKLTLTAAQSCLVSFRENTAMAVIARSQGLSKSTVYRLFYNHIDVPLRFYHLSSTLSIDEFKATTDEGTFAFNITNPITGKTLDIIADRRAYYLRNYFLRFPYKERKKVRIIVMDLSGAFQSIMHALFPNAKIIADKFHYTRLVRENMVQARISCCKQLKDDSLSKLIKNNLHLFDQYKERLHTKKAWYRPYFKKYMTNRQLVEAILELESCEELQINYDIYQNFLDILNKPNSDYKKALNQWLDNIFDTNNQYYMTTAKNFRKKWFLPILRSLTYTAYYIRNGRKIRTCFNNGFIESMNNKVKLVKRNAYGYRYFQNLRKRILLHLGFGYKII